MFDHKPNTAPPCWSRQYEETDRECQECDYKMSCKGAFLRNNGMSQPIAPLPGSPMTQYWQQPVAAPPPPTRLPIYNPSLPIAQTHAPPPPAYAPIPAAVPQNQAPAPAQGTPHSTQYHQYYYPYEGESTGQRLGKHIALRLLEVFFAELSNFFRLWRWPPRRDN